MLSRGWFAALVPIAALILCASASADTPKQAAAALAKQLAVSMRAYYDKGGEGVEITTVSCVLAANEASGHCEAHFTNPSKTILGVFGLRETIDTTTGVAHTKTVSTRCKYAKNDKPVACVVGGAASR